jgi:hypothetical protein
MGLKFWELQNDSVFDILVSLIVSWLFKSFRAFQGLRPFFSRLSVALAACPVLCIFQETFTEFAQPSHAILMLGCGNSRLSEETPMMTVNLKSHNDDRIIDNHWDPQ